MRWSNEMFYILLLNSFAGAIAYGFWMIAKSGMAKKKNWNFDTYNSLTPNWYYKVLR